MNIYEYRLRHVYMSYTHVCIQPINTYHIVRPYFAKYLVPKYDILMYICTYILIGYGSSEPGKKILITYMYFDIDRL